MKRTWDDFDRFEAIIDKYMPARGEGETMASQIATAVNKLVYKWFNDGDVYDNHYQLEGWMNDLSSYANWLYNHTSFDAILDGIAACYTEDNYVELLYTLCEYALNDDYLREMNAFSKEGSIYNEAGPFSFEWFDEEEDEWQYDDEEDDEEDD